MNNPFNYKIFSDCGAPSLYNKLSRKTNHKGIMGTKLSERKFDDYSYTESEEYSKYRDGYIQFLSENKDKITTYSNLDVINNPELTFRNQRILEKAGLSPIPVFHLGNNEKWLRKYVEEYEYIALGGLIPNPTKVLIPWLDKLFKEYILDKDGFPKVKVHGFACTALQLMTRYPWFSVDSATCRKLAMYGWIALPESNSTKVKTYQISARPFSEGKTVEKNEPTLFDREIFDSVINTGSPSIGITDRERRTIDEFAKKIGSDFNTLSNSIIKRVIWNYLVFSEKILYNVPDWPWSIQTRKSKKGANEYLTFYFAGSLSKKEEEMFWKGVTAEEIFKLKGRLQSFFYRGNLEHVIQLKTENNGKEKIQTKAKRIG